MRRGGFRNWIPGCPPAALVEEVVNVLIVDHEQVAMLKGIDGQGEGGQGVLLTCRNEGYDSAGVDELAWGPVPVFKPTVTNPVLVVQPDHFRVAGLVIDRDGDGAPCVVQRVERLCNDGARLSDCWIRHQASNDACVCSGEHSLKLHRFLHGSGVGGSEGAIRGQAGHAAQRPVHVSSWMEPSGQ